MALSAYTQIISPDGRAVFAGGLKPGALLSSWAASCSPSILMKTGDVAMVDMMRISIGGGYLVCSRDQSLLTVHGPLRARELRPGIAFPELDVRGAPTGALLPFGGARPYTWEKGVRLRMSPEYGGSPTFLIRTHEREHIIGAHCYTYLRPLRILGWHFMSGLLLDEQYLRAKANMAAAARHLNGG